jgi:hypothetical protein
LAVLATNVDITELPFSNWTFTSVMLPTLVQLTVTLPPATSSAVESGPVTVIDRSVIWTWAELTVKSLGSFTELILI